MKVPKSIKQTTFFKKHIASSGVFNRIRDSYMKFPQKRETFGLRSYIKLTPKSKWDFSGYRYGKLNALYQVDRKKFLKAKNAIMSSNCDRIGKKKKINVYFIAWTPATWENNSLYDLFKDDDRYDPCILICKISRNNDNARRLFDITKQYFEKKDYRTVVTCDSDSNEPLITWKELSPDIVFVTRPYSIHPSEFDIKNIPLSALAIYIPYGFTISKQGEGYRNVFNGETVRLCWRMAAGSKYEKEYCGEVCALGNSHIIDSGYLATDIFYENNLDTKGNWKIAGEAENPVKIIYAPHHSVDESNPLYFGTFLYNGEMIYEYAKAHPKTTSWIVRPHQVLLDALIKAGVVSSEEEYEQYWQKWDALENVVVDDKGSYMDAFLTSDGMIHDSGSFMAEYMYTGKPQLILCRNPEAFNKMGLGLIDINYHCEKDDFKAIESFIEDVLIKGNDYRRTEREAFFRDNLDYRSDNGGMLAGESIKKYIEDQLGIG